MVKPLRELVTGCYRDGLDFRHLLEKLPAAAYTCDAQGLITYFNERAAQLWGRQPQLNDPVDRFCGSFRLFSSDGAPIHHDACWMALALQNERGYDGHEIIVQRPDGSRRIASAHANPFHDERGRLAGAVNVLVDITEHKLAEAGLREETRITETLHRIGSMLAAELDLDKLVRTVTDEATSLTGAQFGAFFENVVDQPPQGCTRSTLCGAPPEDFQRFPLPRSQPLFDLTFQGQGPVRLEDVTQDPRLQTNGSPDPLPDDPLPIKSYLAVPVISRSGEVLGGLFFGHSQIGVFTDRHERLAVGVAAQAAVAIDNARLYRDAREHAQRLRDADRRKDEFMATLAHELRNPLAPIRSGLELLRLVGDDRAVREEVRIMMEGQATHLVRLVDDLLDISRITSDRITLRICRVDLASVLQSAVEAARPTIEAAGHQLTVTLPPQPLDLQADPTRLAQIFSNLLTNAAKYTENGGRIWLSAERQGSDVVVTVKDTGAGVAADMLDRIFEMFAQVEGSLERSQGGLGIGLTLVKRLVEMHGGSVEARSEGSGTGSQFIVRLPIQIGVRPLQLSGHEDAAAAGKLRVLVVDDNHAAAKVLAMMLKKMGNVVGTAHDGLEALAVAEAFRPDIVLMDIGMPRLNGYDTARQMRTQPWGRDLVLVALSGWGQDEDKQRTKAAGFDQHFVKPMEPAALRRLLADHQPHSA